MSGGLVEFTVGIDSNVLRGAANKVVGIVQRARQEIATELYKWAEDVMGASKGIVPVDTGALMSSGKVMPPRLDPTEISVDLGYGDEATPYALYVHEALEGARPPSPNWSWTKKWQRLGGDPSSVIDWTRPGSGPKYLERPLQEKQKELPARIEKAVLRALGGL